MFEHEGSYLAAYCYLFVWCLGGYDHANGGQAYPEQGQNIE
jgi:hypothetical protein